jgi:hypothetical protein
MSINFEINLRINELSAEVRKVELWARKVPVARYFKVPGFREAMEDIIKVLEARQSTDIPYEKLKPPEIITHNGPGIYSLPR